MRLLLAIGAGRLPFRASCFPPVGCPRKARPGDYVDVMLHSHGYGLSSYTISTRSGKGHTNRYAKEQGRLARGRLTGRARGIISRV